MKTNKILQVCYGERLVGTLAMNGEHKIAFEYNDAWLEEGFPISPFSLPLEKEVFVPQKPYFSGLFGVFADSLPDAWGNILLNRVLREHGIDKDKLNPLDRLAIVGNSGMGALTYQPEVLMNHAVETLDFDKLAKECKNILLSKATDELDELYHLGGTSGGARPKIMTEKESIC